MATNVANCPSITGLIGKSEKKHRLKQRFEVIRKLGQGTYGKVQLAINKETGQEVRTFIIIIFFLYRICFLLYLDLNELVLKF